MAQMRVVTLRLPESLEKRVEEISSKEYMSTGEFMRGSVIRLLLKFRVLPQAIMLDYLQKEMSARVGKKKFESEHEIRELRRIRERLWDERSEGRFG